MKLIFGVDTDWMHWFCCDECGTVVFEGCSDIESDSKWKCPVCSPMDDFPWEFIPGFELKEDSELMELIEEQKKVKTLKGKLKCPACGARDLEAFNLGEIWCNSCNEVILVKEIIGEI